MTSIEHAILAAYQAGGTVETANTVYLAFLKSPFFIPTEKKKKEEAPQVLYIYEDDALYMPVFTQIAYLNTWAHDCLANIDTLHLTSHALLIGLSNTTHLCLDIGTKHYKIFTPEEVDKLKSIVMKLEGNEKICG